MPFLVQFILPLRNHLLLIIVLWSASLFAQVPKAALKQFQKGQKALLAQDQNKSIPYFEKAVAIHPEYSDAHIELYRIYLERDQKNKCLHHIEQAIRGDKKEKSSLMFAAGKSALYFGDYTEARRYLSAYLGQNSKDETVRKVAQKMLSQAAYGEKNIHPERTFKPTYLNAKINTTSLEYLPSLDARGHSLVFTRRIKNDEELFIAKTWGDDTANTRVVSWAQNTELNEGAHTISADGKTIVFTRCGDKEGFGNCDLYFSELKNKVWTKPKNIGHPINSRYWESQPSLSANGQTLYFSSDRPGGQGGLDLWMSYKNQIGWSQPINMGDSINTAWDECSPHLHADGISLYFRSNGWPGFGSYDLFHTVWVGNRWKQPQNMGYPINDHTDQGAMVVAIDGKTAYLTAQVVNAANVLKSSDVVSFQLNEDVAASRCITMSGKILATDVNDPITNAKINIFRPDAPIVKDSFMSDTEGDFLVILPAGKNYQVHVEKQGYVFYSERLVFDSSRLNQEVHHTIFLTSVGNFDSLVVAPKIILKNVLFKTNSDVLEQESYMELDRLVKLLNNHPELRAEVGGHTDNVGTSAYNLALSAQRARAVYSYLVSQHISPTRLSFKGYGDAIPVALNDTEATRTLNRRVEIKLY